MALFTSGDYIALGMFGLGVAGITVREWRAAISKAAATTATERDTQSIITAIKTKMDEVVRTVTGLDNKRQKHELECAKIHERTSANMARTAELLTEHARDIGQLQGQVRHLATGSADKLIEYPVIKGERS